jgi:endonuclease YncB( thermonuclease family)
MATGMLTVTGKLDTSQFWPEARSDADTVKVSVTATSFAFTPDPDKHEARITKAFQGAQVRGRGRTAAIKQGSITIRLQGIDATELHYAALLPKKSAATKLLNNGTDFRQFFAETATVKLHDRFAKAGRSPDCTIVTRVDHPNDVFDTFGRLIGNVLVKIGGQDVDMNLWLAENGWAFPTFYNSMSEREINDVLTRSNAARSGNKGIWPHFMEHVGQLNLGLIERKKVKTFDPKKDVGAVLMPKIFRRLVRFTVSQENQLFTGDFRSFLGQQSDPFLLLSDFLKNPAAKAPGKTTPNGNLESRLSAHEVFKDLPGDLVFFEQPSTLVDAQGKKITKFF